LPRRARVALVTDLHHALQFQSFLVKPLGQVELRPVAHRFLAINILAGPDGIQRLRDMEPVRRGDANSINPRVRQQLTMFHVSLGAGRFGSLIQPVAVSVVHGHDLRILSRFNEPLHSSNMTAPAPAHPDEPDPDSVIGAEDAAARHERYCTQQTQSGGGFGCRLEKLSPAYAPGGFDLGLHSLASVPA
jgi:hypothetical protein